jgi:hypothetical protein
MKNLIPLTALALLISSGVYAQTSAFPEEDKELFHLLRKNPETVAPRGEGSVQVVDHRYEPCKRKKDARYLRIITPAEEGYTVRVIRPEGGLMMEGASKDAQGLVPHGKFRYYDGFGTLRAEGEYAEGIKTGTWCRFDEHGNALPAKEYDGLDWEGKEVKLGLASKSGCAQEIASVRGE